MSTSGLAASLSRVECFAGATDLDFTALADQCDTRRFEAGETIISIGQYDASEVVFILSGHVHAATPCDDRGGLTVEELSGGAVFGLEYALAGAQQLAARVSLMATADTEVAFVGVDVFEDWLSGGDGAFAILRTLARSLVRIKSQGALRDIEPEARVYGAILAAAEPACVGSPLWRVQFMPKHRELAEQAGVSEAVAASAVARLIQEGIARREYPGLLIENYDRLRSFAA